MCPAHVKRSSDMPFDVKESMYIVKEAKYVDMNGFLKGSIIKYQRNSNNIKYRRSLIREECHLEEMVRTHRKYVLSCDIWMGMKTENIPYRELTHSNFLKQILFPRYQLELNTILKILELIYKYIGGFEIFEQSL